VNSIQNTNKLFFWRDFHISPGCLLHNFKELLSAVALLAKAGLFCFWDDKVNIFYLLFQKKMRYFFRLFPFLSSLSSQSRNAISPTLQSTLCLKAGANVWNEFYNPNLSANIFNNIFTFFCIYLVSVCDLNL